MPPGEAHHKTSHTNHRHKQAKRQHWRPPRRDGPRKEADHQAEDSVQETDAAHDLRDPQQGLAVNGRRTDCPAITCKNGVLAYKRPADCLVDEKTESTKNNESTQDAHALPSLAHAELHECKEGHSGQSNCPKPKCYPSDQPGMPVGTRHVRTHKYHYAERVADLQLCFCALLQLLYDAASALGAASPKAHLRVCSVY